MAKTTTPSKKASASTEIVLGQAAQQISKAVNELNSATGTLTKLTSQADELTLLVANKEEQIAALDVEFTEKKRQKEVELDLDFKASKENVVNSFLNENNKVAIAKTDLASLQKELTDTKANAEAETKKQVAIVSSSLKSQFENDLRFLQSENQAKAAENTAKLNALVQNEKNLQEQVDKLYLQLDAERAASIERAKATQGPNITVASEKR